MIIAVEGLPATGKTSLIRELAARLHDASVIEESVLAAPEPPPLQQPEQRDAYFVRADWEKSRLASQKGGTVFLDRYFPSTAIYAVARSDHSVSLSALREYLLRNYAGVAQPDLWLYLVDSIVSREQRRRSPEHLTGLWGDGPGLRSLAEGYRVFFNNLSALQLHNNMIPISSASPGEDIEQIASYLAPLASRGLQR